MAMIEDNKDNRQKSDEILKAKKRAMLILQHNDRTEWELTDKLNKAGFSEEAVESAVEYVRSFHYIDDERYAKRFVEIYHESRSIKRMKQDLYKRHIADEYIELALENIDYDDSTALRRQIEKLGIDADVLSHAAAANGRVGAARQGGVALVHHRLELFGQPLHVFMPRAHNAAEPVRLVGTVFFQPLVALVVALRCGNDPVGVGVTVFFQPPAGAVCGGGVKKQVVAVKHIEYGIFFAGSLPVIRQVNKSPAGQPVRGNADIKRFNHTKSPNSSRANARPKDWYYCTAKTDL